MDNTVLVAVGGLAVALFLIAGLVLLVDHLRQKLDRLAENLGGTVADLTVSVRQVRGNTNALRTTVEGHAQQIQALSDWRAWLLENKPDTLFDHPSPSGEEDTSPEIIRRAAKAAYRNGGS
jgi:hypothetical protein